MRYHEFLKQLAGDEIAPVYLFKGDAGLLMDEAWQQLTAKVVPAKARRLNGERLQARDCSAGQVLEKVRTLPMFGPRQLVMVQNIDSWPKDQLQQLLSYLERPQPSACLVLTAAQSKGLDRIEAAVEATGRVVTFVAPSDRDAPRWLQERAAMRGKKMTLEAAGMLFEQVGLDLHRLELELDKLIQYVGERETIRLEDVAEAVSSQRGSSVFALLDHIARGEKRLAVNALRNLLRAGEAPLAILALIARQLRLVWQASDALKRGASLPDLARELRLPPTIAKKYMQQSTAFSTEQLRRFHGEICLADMALKSSGTNPEWVLEDLVVRLSGKARN